MKYPSSYQELEFRKSVDRALERVRTILDATRFPRVAHEDEDHRYDDKFALVEFLINTGISAQINALDLLGLDETKLRQILSWVHDDKESVTLRFHAEETCSFLTERVVEVEPNVSHEFESCTTTESAGSSTRESTKVKVVTKMREYDWKVGINYRIIVFKGPSPKKDTSVLMIGRNASTVLVTSGGQVKPDDKRTHEPSSPLPARKVNSPIDVNVTWLFQNISPESLQCQFSIDRDSVLAKRVCKTPRRNEDVEDALAFTNKFSAWAFPTKDYFIKHVESVTSQHRPVSSTPEAGVPSLRSVTGESLFVPVIPLMEKGTVLSSDDMEKFINEQMRSLDEGIAQVGTSYPSKEVDKLVTEAEAKIVLIAVHILQITRHCELGVDYVEDMLEKQVIKAIGKEVTPKDFEDFLKYYYRKLFAPSYAPRPFCYAIRRPEHYPDGVLSIESASGDNEPIQTWVRHVPASDRPSPMFIPIGPATNVELHCDCYLHGWMKPNFRGQCDSFRAVARARQFSSFLLVVGTMSGANTFDPKQAIILQNKDEVIIPLLIETLPSSRDFKDAISSLSPEQQDFARSFRAMQLGSSVFGVCVIQLKPQLERLLSLPDGALTKEIKLTQDLMSLFVEYQIPSDLLSYHGVGDTSLAEKVASVRKYVDSVLEVIAGEKKQQLEDEKMKSSMRQERSFGGLPTYSRVLRTVGSAANTWDEDLLHMRDKGRSTEVRVASSAYAHDENSVGGFNSIASTASIASNDRRLITKETNDATSDPIALQDFTAIPGILDRVFDQFDTDNSLKSSIIKPKENWELRQQKNLLVDPESQTLDSDDVCDQKKKAYDLLDAISRSGALSIQAAELHVVVAVSHCFENDIMGSIIQDNINPISKVEKSSLLIASTIYGIGETALLAKTEMSRT